MNRRQKWGSGCILLKIFANKPAAFQSLKRSRNFLYLAICQHSGIRSFERLAKEDGAEDKGENLRDREAEPHELQFSGLRQQPSRRQQHHELAAHGVDERVQRISDGLEHRAGDNAETCEQEVNGDNAEGGDPDLAHMVGRVKKRQQRSGNELKERQANEHQADRGNDGQADGFLHALGLSRAVVVGDDRDHAVIEAEDRHEDKALELEIDAEDGRRRGRKDDEDLVKTKVHDRTDGHHERSWFLCIR